MRRSGPAEAVHDAVVKCVLGDKTRRQPALVRNIAVAAVSLDHECAVRAGDAGAQVSAGHVYDLDRIAVGIGVIGQQIAHQCLALRDGGRIVDGQRRQVGLDLLLDRAHMREQRGTGAVRCQKLIDRRIAGRDGSGNRSGERARLDSLKLRDAGEQPGDRCGIGEIERCTGGETINGSGNDRERILLGDRLVCRRARRSRLPSR